MEKEQLNLYLELGLTFIKLGKEARVNLREFLWTGASHSGLRQYKEKYDTQRHPKYLACPKGFMPPRILANIAPLISDGIKGIVMK